MILPQKIKYLFLPQGIRLNAGTAPATVIGGRTDKSGLFSNLRRTPARSENFAPQTKPHHATVERWEGAAEDERKSGYLPRRRTGFKRAEGAWQRLTDVAVDIRGRRCPTPSRVYFIQTRRSSSCEANRMLSHCFYLCSHY